MSSSSELWWVPSYNHVGFVTSPSNLGTSTATITPLVWNYKPSVAMQAVGRLGSFITRGVCTVSGPFLPYGGAVDIIVVQQKDGSFKSSPWFIRFGKLHRVLKANEKVVNISVNGVEPDFQMYMNHQGEAFFLKEVNSEELEDGVSALYESSSSDDAEDDVSLGSNNRNFKSKSCKFDLDRSSSGDLGESNNGSSTLNRTSSHRSRILGLVLGQRSFKREVQEGIELMERAEVAANLYELMWSTNLTVDKLPPRDRKKTQGDTTENSLQPPKIKMEAVCDATRSDLKVAFVDFESSIEKNLNQEVSGVTKGDMGNNNSENNISAEGVRLPDYDALAKVLQDRTVLISEVAESAKVTKSNDLNIPAMDVSQLLSQQRDYKDVGVKNQPKFQKSHTINVLQRQNPVNKVRENTPTSEQLASLNLKEGRNMVTFSCFTAMLGTQQVEARIFLWKWDTRIVISDVDGTITRSDVLGQFMPMVGIDWSQSGVAHLFSAIQDNGYQLLFLSARAISQAYHTRRFLFNLKQDGKVLPDGPVVISPDGLFPALYREVIRRAPHEFKITCLEGIKSLFPPDCNPFYAGFGNRETDEISYLKVGIPRGKIFIINPKGEIAINRCLDPKSYTSLHAVVNGMFPPTDSFEQEDFNSWNYWKMPPVF